MPDEFVGGVMCDLSTRRGRVLGTEAEPDVAERSIVRAEVPATELVRYAVELRSMTSGTGTFSRSFVRHDPMPGNLADQVKKEHVAAAGLTRSRRRGRGRADSSRPRLIGRVAADRHRVAGGGGSAVRRGTRRWRSRADATR